MSGPNAVLTSSGRASAANGEQTGRTLSGTSHTLTFDYDGQLTQISQGQNTTDFAYDALGRRFSRTAGGTTTEFIYDEDEEVLEKQGGNYTQAYTMGNGLLRRGSEYPMFDGHGSERTVTSSNQTVTGTANYEAFGQTVGTTGSSASPYMYAGDWGYRNDGDAGLMHVGARYCDAQVGRFITRDMDLDQHAYLYCMHEPVSYLDPDGAGPRDGSGGKGKGRGKGGGAGKGVGKPWWWPATLTVSIGVVSATWNGGDLWRSIPPGDRAKLRNAKELGWYMWNKQ